MIGCRRLDKVHVLATSFFNGVELALSLIFFLKARIFKLGSHVLWFDLKPRCTILCILKPVWHCKNMFEVTDDEPSSTEACGAVTQ